MPRLPRFNIVGFPYYIFHKQNNTKNIFVDAQDFSFYIQKLYEYSNQEYVSIHAYTLARGQVHLLATPKKENGISEMMQHLGRSYARYFNKRYGHRGSVFQGRYRSTMVEAENYLLICQQHIECLPKQFNLCSNPADYTWSSYRHNALGEKDILLTFHEAYLRLGCTKDERAAAYRQLFNSKSVGQPFKILNNPTNNSWVLGNKEFRSLIETRYSRQAIPKPRGGDRRSKKQDDSNSTAKNISE